MENANILQAALAASLFYLSWLILRPFIVKSPLDNIPGPPRDSWFTGNMKEYFTSNCWDYRTELSRKYPRVALLHGILGARVLQVWDIKAMYEIFVKEMDTYEEPVQILLLLLGPGLLGTLGGGTATMVPYYVNIGQIIGAGKQHRKQRKMLNPVFSVKHLRDMTPLFYEVIHKTRDAIMQRVRTDIDGRDGVELDILSWSGRTTLEILGQAGLGVSFDPLTEDQPDEFATAVKEFFPQVARSVAFRGLVPIVTKLGPASFRRWVVERIPLDAVQQLRRICDVMHNRSVQIFNEKKAALGSGDDTIKNQIGEGRDIMSILLRENMLASEDDKLPDDELIAQISTMVLAGMDTTANSLARVLQLLADRPDVQDKLRREILQAVERDGDGDRLDFDKVMELPYLEAVCRETLRVYPGVTNLFRRTTKDVVVPLSEPIRMRDGTIVDAIPIPKGTEILPNVVASNVDPALWGPDADVWRPERWLEPLPRAVEEARVPGVYSHLMTFIGGNKSCIGFKFAQVEMKTVLLILLQYFEFKPTGKQIFWNFAGVQYPSVGKPGPDPGLPLIVSTLRP